MNMKCFVINLKKNADRMNKVASRLRALNIEFERIEAVYGKELSLEEKRASVNSFRWWCTKGYKIRDGEIGCTCSHNKIYERMMNEGIGYCCILEDDVVASDLFPKQLEKVASFLRSHPQEPIIVQFTNHSGTTGPDWTISAIMNSAHSEAYALNMMAAKSYLKANRPLCTPVDMWGYWQKKGVFRLYQAYPPVCKQDWSPGYVTDVCPPGSFDASKLSLVGKIIWKIKRCIGKGLDEILY